MWSWPRSWPEGLWGRRPLHLHLRQKPPKSAKISAGSMAVMLRRLAQRSAAAPWSHTAAMAASSGLRPFLVLRPAAPGSARTSTSPCCRPQASPALPVLLCQSVPSGLATSVPLPFKMAMQSYFSAAAARPAPNRPESRPRICPAAARPRQVRRQDRVGGQSAPEFAGSQRVQGIGVQHSPAPWGILPKAGRGIPRGRSPPARGRPAGRRFCNRQTSPAGRQRHAGGCRRFAAVRQPQAQHSGVRASTSCATGSTLARKTSPAPPAAPLCAECSRAGPCCLPQPVRCRSFPFVAVCPALRQQLLYQLLCDLALHLASLRKCIIIGTV